MCFKGDDGVMNQNLFQMHQIEAPRFEDSNNYTKIYTILQIDKFRKQYFTGCEYIG